MLPVFEPAGRFTIINNQNKAYEKMFNLASSHALYCSFVGSECRLSSEERLSIGKEKDF
jgi:hypothetical protein